MKLRWAEHEMGQIISDDGRVAFEVGATRFANGVQCIGASFHSGTTYIAMDEFTGLVRLFVIPSDAPAPDELYNAKMRFVRADLLLKAYGEMGAGE